MSTSHLSNLAVALLAASTPMLVAHVAWLTARRQAERAGTPVARPRSVRWLAVTTVMVAAVAAGIAVSMPVASAWMAVVDLGAFGVAAAVGARVLADLDRATHATRLVDESSRMASLVPRRLTHYVPIRLRAGVMCGLALGLLSFVYRAMEPAAGRQYMVPVVSAFAAVVFYWLYEVWQRELVAGPVLAGSAQDESHRRAAIATVFRAQSVLVAVCLVVAHALLDLNWIAYGGLGAAIAIAGALAGVLGCAFAVASGLGRTTYVTAR